MGVRRTGIAFCLLLVASACGGSESSVTSSASTTPAASAIDTPDLTTTPEPTAPATTTATTTATTSAATEVVTSTVPPSTTNEPEPVSEPTMIDVKVYYLRGERLASAHRQVAAPAVLRGALTAVLAGPSTSERTAGLSTEIPPATTLRDVSLADGQAIVDLTRDYESGGGTLSMTARLAQVVFTATQFDDVDRVLFWLDGEPVRFFGGEGVVLDEPQARVNVDRAFTGGVIIDTPLPGATVRSPLVVTGEGDLFEGDSALWVWRNGEPIAGPFLIQAGALGMWAEFETTVTLDVAPGPIELILDDGNGCTPGDPECGVPNPAVVPLKLEG